MGLACLLAFAVAAPTAQAGTTTQLTNFGSNPNNLPMYLYTPSNVVAKPPILVHLHACHAQNGGQSMCSSGNSFAQQADKYGFVMVCPSAVSADQCWDVHSTADLTHNGTGSDAEGIMSAVSYIIANKNGDANRVYVAGYSSGGMMTDALLGSYPDVFKAGAAFAGVPFGCFAQGSIDDKGWSSTCANGKVSMTAAQWGDLVRAAYPGFNGTRPRIQLWHGTADTTVNFANFTNEIAQWTNVLGVSGTPTTTENNTPQTTWIRTRYIDNAGVVQVEAIQETGKGHGDLAVDPYAGDAIRFLGLDGSSPVPDAGAVKDSATPPDSFIKMDSAGSTGGTTATGGARATGGALATGGAAVNGGAVATGGALATGGGLSTGGTVGRGGMTASGGVSGNGGAVGSGGVIASGGLSGTGGTGRTGGTTGSGGTVQTGGSLGSGGGVGTGGSATMGGSASGGSSATSQGTAGTSGAGSGGSTGTGNSDVNPAGCSCSLSGGGFNRFPPIGLLLVLGLLAFARRRRDSK
jgi:poly(hydroxyalkanoate) depolymerase family esterase